MRVRFHLEKCIMAGSMGKTILLIIIQDMISGSLGNGEIWVFVRLMICAQKLAGFEWTICNILLSTVHYEPMFCGVFYGVVALKNWVVTIHSHS